MRKIILLLFTALVFTGCAAKKAQIKGGGGSYDKSAMAEEAEYYSSGKPVQAMKVKLANSADADVSSAARMVIYNSTFAISVENIKTSSARLEKIAADFKGFIESYETSNSYQKASIVIRVPVAGFDKCILEVEKIGQVTSKNISAEDVTEKYTNMKLREESLRKIRERLYALLKRAVKPEEKVKILKEISRITSEIEVLNANLEYYRNKAAYSTINITLNAQMKQNTVNYIPSPFEWIRNLNVSNVSTEKSGLFANKLKYSVPAGYFDRRDLFRKGRSNYIFITPGFTSGIRAGFTDNYPSADDSFWKEALLIDAQNRFYKLIEEKQSGGRKYTVLIFRLADSTYYSVAFKTVGKRIVVAEAYFSTEEKYNEYREIYFKFLNNLEY